MKNVNLYSQQVSLRLYDVESGAMKEEKKFSSLDEATLEAQLIIPVLRDDGYISASIDSFYHSDTTLYLYLFLGKRYLWGKIVVDSIPEIWKDNFESQIKSLEGKPVNPQNLTEIFEKTLKLADEIGYPFAKIELQNLAYQYDSIVKANYVFRNGSEYNIDSISIHYDGRLNDRYIYRYLDIENGMKYSPKKLRTLSPLISSLPFLEEEKPWELKFQSNYNSLHVHLKERKANQANAILGFQPSQQEDKKFDFTADVLLLFHNEFGYGERMKYAYQQLQNNSPKMNIEISWPFIAGTSFGFDGSFEYQKVDTFFRKTHSDLGVLYQFSAQEYVKFFLEIQSNRIISFDTSFVRNNNKLPPNIDVSSQGAGMAIQFNKLDNVLNPRKGWMFNTSFTGSQRRVLPNNALTTIYNADGNNFTYLYDTLTAPQVQIKVRTSAAAFLPIWKMFTLKVGYENGYLYSKQLFRNELYQLGGFKLLRGFNELSMFSNHFHIGTIEPRMRIGGLSYVYLFSDFGYLYSLNTNNESTSFGVVSTGLGGTISTPSGIFNIAFGIGKQGNETLRFSDTRVHFGYSIYF